jgi:hypothetical protein
MPMINNTKVIKSVVSSKKIKNDTQIEEDSEEFIADAYQ